MATLLGSSALQFPSPPRNRSPSTPANSRFVQDSSPGQVLASSPLLHEDTRGGLQQNVIHSNRGGPSIQVDGAEDVGWEGGDFGADSSDYKDSDPHYLGTRSRSSTVDGDLTDSDLTDGQQVTGESPSYGALSRRAESILRNAKAKLNLLDTNLKGARHSLVTPSGTNPNLRSSSSASMHLPTISSDEEEDSEVYPSRPASNTRTKYSPQMSRRGHNRVFSETSIPSEQGLTPKGSRNMDYVRNRSHDNRSPSARARAEFEGQLGPVLEDEFEEPQPVHDEGRNRSTSITKDLRAQADDLRQRLSFLQARARDDTRKRNSHRLSSSFGSASEVDPETFNTQVRALEQSLQRQEQVIAELESAEVNKTQTQTQDPRTEWSRVIDHQNQVGVPLDGSDGDEDDEDDIELEEEDDMDHENFRDVLKMDEYQQEEEDEEDMERPHEERADVFDYETFILHSTMGTYEGMRPQSISGSSSGSRSTTRADDEDSSENEDDNSDDERDSSAAYQQPNESVASFETAHSQRNANTHGSSSDADSEDEEDEWPVPPSTRSPDMTHSVNPQVNSRAVKNEMKTPIVATTQRTQAEPQRPRPTSAIFAALTTPEQASSPLTSLNEKDTALLYSLAENLRNACLHIQESSSSRDASIWRDRLEQARQILGG